MIWICLWLYVMGGVWVIGDCQMDGGDMTWRAWVLVVGWPFLLTVTLILAALDACHAILSRMLRP